MSAYRHTQRGILLRRVLGGGSLICALAAVAWAGSEPPAAAIAGSVAAGLAIALYLFGSLSVEVSSESITLRFGPGLIRKRFAVAGVADLRVVRNRWIYSWGIRLTPHGWLYNVSGLNAVVVGRSNIVGKPMANLLLQANATVTICHSRTRDVANVCRQADILVAAVGRANMIKGDWIKPGAVVIDVGINRIEVTVDGETKSKLTGDVDLAEAMSVAGAITPVPGGVGPMTIVMLMFNTLRSARLAAGITD